MTTELKDDPDEKDERSHLLKTLRRVEAPWHFEAGLRQRLADLKDKKRPFVLRPAFALPFAGLAAALVLYLSVPPSDETLPDPLPFPDPVLQSPSRKAQKKVEQAPLAEPSGPGQDVMLQSEISPQTGSSDDSPEVLPATIASPAVNGQGRSMKPQELALESTDSSVQASARADSVDSLKSPRDSLDKR